MGTDSEKLKDKERRMARKPLSLFWSIGLSLMLAGSIGCRSPYHSDQGALFGGLLGAGTGAIVGNAVGNTGAGAAIGAGVGALSGAATGGAIDEMEAQNRAIIAQQLGRQVNSGSVTVNDVVEMTRAGVNEELIANHVRANGVAAPLQSNDLIRLQQEGVSTHVVTAMQAPPRNVQPVVVQQTNPAPVIVEEYHYPAPCYRPYCRHPRPGMQWGIAIGH